MEKFLFLVSLHVVNFLLLRENKVAGLHGIFLGF